MDIAPQYADVEYLSEVKLIGDYDITKPKVKKSTDMHPYLMIEPTKVDFRREGEDYSQLMNITLKGEEPAHYIADMSKED